MVRACECDSSTMAVFWLMIGAVSSFAIQQAAEMCISMLLSAVYRQKIINIDCA